MVTAEITDDATEVTNTVSQILLCDNQSGGDTAVFSFHLSAISVIAGICIFGNTLVIFVMTQKNKIKTPFNSLITSLAASDLLQGLVYALYNLSHINIDFIRFTLGQS